MSVRVKTEGRSAGESPSREREQLPVQQSLNASLWFYGISINLLVTETRGSSGSTRKLIKADNNMEQQNTQSRPPEDHFIP